MRAWLDRLIRKHVVELRSIDGETQRTDRFWAARSAREYARTMRAPFYDVLIDGKVVWPHTPPDEYVAGLRG